MQPTPETTPVRPEDEKLGLFANLAYGIQHILTMYGGIVAVPLIVGQAAGLSPADIGLLVTASLFAGGVATILQTIGLPQVGTQPVQPAAGPPVQTMPGQQAPGPLGAGPQAPGPQASGPHTAGPNGTPAPGQNQQVNGAQQGRYPGQANQTSARYGG